MAIVHLTWDANPESEQVTSYKVSQSVNGGSYLLKTTVTVPEADIEILTPGIYSWKVVACNLAGESPAAQIDGPGLPTPPANGAVQVL